MAIRQTILVFVKDPAPGRVKTRLAAVVGDRFAVAIYRAFVEDVLSVCRSVGVPITVMVSPAEAVQEVRTWLGKMHRYCAQEGSDLGERMSHAFSGAFEEGFKEAILIGTDIPDLRPEFLEEGFRALAVNDVVIGPASDGGYYAIGFRAEGFRPEVFEGVEWSTDSVYTRTCALLEMNRVSWHVLPVWDDVDRFEDLERLMERIEGTEHASRSRACYRNCLSHDDQP